MPKKSNLPCTVGDCLKFIFSGGLCCAHYAKLRKYGNPLISKHNIGIGSTPEERFWSRIAVTDDDTKCWEWTGRRNDSNYGAIGYKGRTTRSHRMVWFYIYGKWPDGLLRHTCDNPPCCNPAHLLEGTHQDNRNDCKERNRHALGERVGSSILTTQNVIDIKKRLRNGESCKNIAKDFPVGRAAITEIKFERNWAWIKLKD